MDKQPTTYILASGRNGTLYIGVTSDLIARVWQHRKHLADGFMKKHRVIMLVWFEQHGSMEAAIMREKRLKKWNRDWKIRLIEEWNPYSRDLLPEIAQWRKSLGPRLRGDDGFDIASTERTRCS